MYISFRQIYHGMNHRHGKEEMKKKKKKIKLQYFHIIVYSISRSF